MKRNDWLFILLTMLCGFILLACNNNGTEQEEPEKEKTQATLPDKDGFVVLASGEYVEATTDFTDEELLATLQSKCWCPYVETYFYNEKQEIGFNDKLNYNVFNVRFKNDGTFEERHFDSIITGNTTERKFQYSVKNKIITTSDFSRSIWYSPIYDLNVSFKVISVDKNRIIVDVPYTALLIGGNCVIDLIDTETAMTRMVWKPYNQ